MPNYSVPSERGYAVIPLDQAKGKRLRSIQISQDEGALNVDVGFDDNTMVELIFRVGFDMSANLLDWKGGNSRILKKIKPKRHD